MRWTKSKIGEHFSNTAIMLGNYHIAKYLTYIDGVKVEKYCLWDCSDKIHKQIEWSADVDKLKSLAESLIGEK